MTTRTWKVAAATWLVALGLWQGVARAEEAWLAEYEATCARTTDSMALSVGELAQLIERCDKLQKVIETQEESLKKVYLKRLQMCRNLYVYVLEYKKNGQQGE